MKEIKVKYIEQENYLELWKAIKAEKGEPKYYGRDIGDEMCIRDRDSSL